MSIADWATTVSGALAVIAALGWIVKRYLVELKPNHGSSLRDAVDCIQKDISAISVDLARLEGKFEQHTEEHLR
jgi:hypothetical protein